MLESNGIFNVLLICDLKCGKSTIGEEIRNTLKNQNNWGNERNTLIEVCSTENAAETLNKS